MSDLTIVTEKRNDMLKRREVVMQAEFAGKSTPAEAGLQKSLAEKLKTTESLVVIKKIRQVYGSPRAVIDAYIYDDETTRKAIETVNKKKKPEQAKQAAQQPKEGGK